jgi:hypothetical protein
LFRYEIQNGGYGSGGHLGFPIGIKNSYLVKDIPMIILLQFGFSQFISFREEDLEISANQSILLALAAMLNIRLERKTVTLPYLGRRYSIPRV